MDISLIIQAGGESRRMGQDKALIPFNGKPLIQSVIGRLTGFSEDIVITTNRPESYTFLGVRLASDVFPGKGAAGGLYTALNAASFPLAAVVGCDMPFVNQALLRALLKIIEVEELDAVMPSSPNGPEPLHAIYRPRACLQPIWRALMAGYGKMIAFLPAIRSRILTAEETGKFDPQFRMFQNINTPNDIILAEGMLREDPSLGIGTGFQRSPQ